MPKKNKPLSKQQSRDSQSEEDEKSRRHEAVRRELIISEEQKQDMEKEIPTMRVITASAIAQKYSVRVSIAKAVLAELESKGLIRQVASEGKFRLYSKVTG
ncbi:MAG: eS25 family ribosomal protein [Candidatus Hermodarchaeota archaeon]|jgi:ribosomal protein S25|nr:eS25 family ribosomal protein [Candidatus Hermodarchaeota archaeon]